MSTSKRPPPQYPGAREDSADVPGSPGTMLQLRGRDHPTHGVVSVAIPTRGVALATSAGSRPKPNPPIDRNEDCVAAVHGAHGDLLIVADAHHGADAAEFAIDS